MIENLVAQVVNCKDHVLHTTECCDQFLEQSYVGINPNVVSRDDKYSNSSKSSKIEKISTLRC